MHDLWFWKRSQSLHYVIVHTSYSRRIQNLRKGWTKMKGELKLLCRKFEPSTWGYSHETKKITYNHYTISPTCDKYLQSNYYYIFRGVGWNPLEPPEIHLIQLYIQLWYLWKNYLYWMSHLDEYMNNSNMCPNISICFCIWMCLLWVRRDFAIEMFCSFREL